MKRFLLFSIAFMYLLTSILGQKSETKSNSPKEDVRVNREYDEKGNMIKFDSVYTYSWSGDSTILKSQSPEDYKNLFRNHFGNFSDSTFLGNSFFDDFDQLFPQPFNGKQDSLLMKKFDLSHQFHNFRFNNDSLALNFKDFYDLFKNFGVDKSDSISSKSPGKMHQLSHSKSMEDMMKMLQQQMKEMEKQHKEFFEEEPKWQEF